MTGSLYMPDVTVELALNAGYTTAAASRTWTDVSSYVELDQGIRISRGRGDEQSVPSPSKLGLTFANTDGRFTPELVTGAYYPNIKMGRPIRVRVGIPNTVVAFDNFSAADSTVAVWDAPAGPGRVTPAGGSYTWTGDTSKDWGIISNKAYSSAVGGDVTIDVGLSDVEVEATFTTGAALVDAGLDLRWVDANNRITVRVDSGGGGRWLIQKVVAGVVTNVVSGGVAAVSTTYNMRVVLSGSSVDLYVNSVLTLSATIGDAVLLSATRFGLRGNTTDYRWDDFWVRATVYNYRYLGYAEEWPVEWPGGTESFSTVAVSASSRRARTNLLAAFRSIVEEEHLYDDPTALWRLSEPAGSTTAGDVSGNSQTPPLVVAGSGTAVVFGSATGPGTDGLTAAVFANGQYLACMFSTATIGVEFAMVTSTTTQTIMDLTSPSNSIAISVTAAGKLQAVWSGTTLTSGTTVSDGLLHHVAVFDDGGTLRLYIDGVSDGSTASPGGLGGLLAVRVGVGYTGTLAYVTLNAESGGVSRVTAHAQSMSTGFSGEASGARIARYARLAGIPTAEISTETGMSTSIAHADTTGRGPVEMMDAVALTEDGVVFDGKDGTLTFHARSHRYGAVSAFTLNLQAGYVETGLSPKLDNQGLLNDVKASRAGGIEAHAVNQTSIDENGYYRESFDLMTTSDDEVQYRADWEVGRHGTPRTTIASVKVNLLASGLEAALLAADIGTRITLSNLPANAPASTMDFFIEGITEDIGRESYFIEFNVSPAALSNVWILDSATASQLDSTSILAY